MGSGKDKPAKDPIEGFEIIDGKYVCTYVFQLGEYNPPCRKEYVRRNGAENHAISHRVYDEHKADLAKANVPPSPANDPGKGLKGDAIRELIQPLKDGRIDVPHLIKMLETTAVAVDMLHQELASANIRELQDKAKAHDTIVEILSNDPWLRKVLHATADQKEE